jgi:hypothetical protein
MVRAEKSLDTGAAAAALPARMTSTELIMQRCAIYMSKGNPGGRGMSTAMPAGRPRDCDGVRAKPFWMIAYI